MAEQHDEWTESCRYLSLELIQQSQTADTEPTGALDQKEDNTPDLALSA